MRALFLSTILLSIAIAQVPTPEGDALFAKGDWAGAAREFKRATDANPEDGRAWFRLGSALHRMGKYEEAVQAFETAVKYQFQTPYAIAAVSRSYAAQDQRDKAWNGWTARPRPALDNSPLLTLTRLSQN